MSIVRSQSTEWLALRPDWDGKPDFDGVIGHDHAADEQRSQLSPAAGLCLFEALSHTPAERLGMGGAASGFSLAVSSVREFAFPARGKAVPTGASNDHSRKMKQHEGTEH